MEEDPANSPDFLISRTAHLLRQHVRDAIVDAGLRLAPEEFAILGMLSRSDEPQRVGELANTMVRDATTLTRQLDNLVKQQLVERRQSATDRRVVLVTITDEGRRLVRTLSPSVADVRRRALVGVAAEDLAKLVATVQQIQANLNSSN